MYYETYFTHKNNNKYLLILFLATLVLLPYSLFAHVANSPSETAFSTDDVIARKQNSMDFSKRASHNPYRLRIAYVIPSNRSPQPDAMATIQSFIQSTQAWFREEMQRHGFGPKTFSYEIDEYGLRPKVHYIYSRYPDSFFHDRTFGGAVTALNEAGFQVGASVPETKWFVVVESQEMESDGSFTGPLFGGTYRGGYGMVTGETLIRLRLRSLTDERSYAGMVIPELGLFPMIQGISFPYYEGSSIRTISASGHGGAMHELGHAIGGLIHDFRNENNNQGNLMGNGFRRLYGSYYSEDYPGEYTRLGSNSAYMLNVNPFFNSSLDISDSESPSISIETSGTVIPENGLCSIDFTAADNERLGTATLIRVTDGHWDVEGEMLLDGDFVQSSMGTSRYDAGANERWEVLISDWAGNMSFTATDIVCAAGHNQAPTPSISIYPSQQAMVGEPLLFDARESRDPDSAYGDLRIEWDLDMDGEYDTNRFSSLHFENWYNEPGFYQPSARIWDADGGNSITTRFGIRVGKANFAASANQFQVPNIPENTLDGDFVSRWAAFGKGVTIEFDLLQETKLFGLEIAWFRGDSRKAQFDIEVSDDGSDWTRLLTGQSSGSTLDLEQYPFPDGPVSTKFLRITGLGNTENDWTSITEVGVMTGPLVSANEIQVPNMPENTLDKNLLTRWAAQGDGVSISYDLLQVQRISGVKLAWFRGDSRVAYFDIDVSNDGNAWRTIYEGSSAGATAGFEGLEYLPLDPVLARYLRIVGHGNSSNDWTSLYEVEILGDTTVSASDFQIPNEPRFVLDGDLQTRWAAEGVSQWINFSLDHEEQIGSVSIAWYRGDQRQANFEIETSIDGQEWVSVYSGSSSGNTLALESYDFTPFTARFVRVKGYGNSQNDWISITEMQVGN